MTPVLGEKAAHNGKVVYSLDFHVTPHQLRHTYITNLIHASVDPKTVQYLAGHENSKITMDIYAKVKYNKPKELIGIVNKAFGQTMRIKTQNRIQGFKVGLIFKETPQKVSIIKGFRALSINEYGLKAARRAPQFSKR